MYTYSYAEQSSLYVVSL